MLKLLKKTAVIAAIHNLQSEFVYSFEPQIKNPQRHGQENIFQPTK